MPAQKKPGDPDSLKDYIFIRTMLSIIAHEILHTLGAKHPQDIEPSNPNSSRIDPAKNRELFMQTIMGIPTPQQAGKILGPLDVIWLQRKFGNKKDSEIQIK